MQLPPFSFQLIDWTAVDKEKHEGETGHAFWQIKFMGEIRIRRVQYSENYKADHWCKKGHIIHCLSGGMTTELEDGRKMELAAGMTYIVGDNSEAHRTFTATGCVLFIVD